MISYRRAKDSDTWHDNPACSQMPKKDFVEIKGKKPTYGELCNECRAKASAPARKPKKKSR